MVTLAAWQLWVLTMGLGLVFVANLQTGFGAVARGSALAFVLVLGLALRSSGRELGGTAIRVRTLAVFRLALILAAGLALQTLALRWPVHFTMASQPSLDLDPLVELASRIPGPLEFVVFGPEGHRRVRAAEEILTLLAGRRSGISVHRRDPGRSPPIHGLARRAQLGEVLISGGGRRALAVDASLRSLGGALRGLADSRPRRVVFLADEPVPGAPGEFKRAAAAIASDLAADCVAGRPDPSARLWIWLGGLSPEPSLEQLRVHLESGGGLLVLAEAAPSEGLARYLQEHEIRLHDGFLLDDHGGARRDRGTLRVESLTGVSEVALLSGCLPVGRETDGAASLGFGTRWIRPVASTEVDEGEAPAAGGRIRLRRSEFAGVYLSIGPGWLGVVGDSDFASGAGLATAGNREFLLALASLGMDRFLGLPRDQAPPTGGIDPDLAPEAFRRLVLLLLLGLPCLPLMMAAALRLQGSGTRSTPTRPTQPVQQGSSEGARSPAK